ncbi:MAG: aminotransferase class V-fold PLP-dependent enzyme, partial [Chlamydiia bacterium]|nr:aminotransferase class V-fold PLP-dependent enzyme [Chlamydiia bacterium]
EAEVLFQGTERLPHITTIVFPGVFSELLAFHLREAGVFVSWGGGRNQKLEHILRACGLDSLTAKSTLNFSLSRETTEEEIRRTIGIVVDCAQRCRTYSRKVMP